MTDPFALWDAAKRRAIDASVSDKIIRQAAECLAAEGARLLDELVNAGPSAISQANALMTQGARHADATPGADEH